MSAEPSWSIPGYAADQFVGGGPLGDVWTGRALADGAAVTLEEAGPVPPDVLELLRMFGRFPAEGHPHLWPVREVVAVPGRTLVVRDRAAGGSLATLVLHRGRLEAGEVATIVGPLASALAYLHEERIVHSAITPERILFDADGRPALAGVGIDDLLGAGSAVRVPVDHLDPAVTTGAAPSAATDVFMLASCGLAALGGRAAPAGALPDVLTRAVNPDPSGRPTAAELADSVNAACPPEPVRLLVPEPGTRPEAPPPPTIPPEWLAPGRRVPPYLSVPPDRSGSVEPAAFDRLPPRVPAPPRSVPSGSAASGSGNRVAEPQPLRAASRREGLHRLRRTGGQGRRIALALFVAGLLVVAGAIWFRLPTAAPGQVAQPAPTAAAQGTDRWLRVLDGLDAVRATAYERGDVALLARVWVSGARLRADAAQLRALLSTGCTARGVRHGFGGVTVLGVDAQRVRLRVTQWLPASQRLRAGRVVGEFAASPPATVPLDLVATDGGWRLG